MTQSKQELRADTYTTTAEFAAIPQHEAVAFADNGALVAVTGPAGDPEARRFARLFVAAPKMLEALRGLLGVMESWEDPEAADSAEYRAARDVLAKATGGEG